MKRKLLLVVLALGTVAGYASAVGCHHGERHRAWKQEVADLCVAAAERRLSEKAGQRP